MSLIALRPFGTSDLYTSSIALDASTRGNVTVASAVFVSREEEVEILQSIIDQMDDVAVEFRPFKTKSRRIDPDDHFDVYKGILQANEDRKYLLHFHHRSAKKNQHYTEAVLTAILSEKIVARVDDDPLIIIDGDQNILRRFGQAYYALADEFPAVTNCFQSEQYYPQSLLADLSAGYIAHQIDNGLYDYEEPEIRAKAADAKFSKEWGSAYSYLQSNPNVDVERADVRAGYSDSPEGRAEMWFTGHMGRNSDDSAGVDLSTVISRIESMGYPDVAQRLREM